MYVYIATTNDKYEFPIAIEDNPRSLSKKINVGVNKIYVAIRRECKKSHTDMKIFKVKI